MNIQPADVIPLIKFNAAAFTIEALQKEIGVGRSTIYEELNAGRLVAKKCDKLTLIPIWSVVTWLCNLPDYVPGQRYVKRGEQE